MRVDAYGTEMPLPQVGTIAVPEPRMITVQVWDRSLVKAVVMAIRDCGLGLNPLGRRPARPRADPAAHRRAPHRAGQGRPPLCRGRQGGGARRPPRRHGPVKALEKKGAISQDDEKRWAERGAEADRSYIKRIDEALAEKDKEIKQV